MPYIKQDRREYLEPYFADIVHRLLSEGDLNYVITRLVQEFVKDLGNNYAAFNSAIGVLECAKLELYRRKVAPYEDTKIRVNGDV